MQSAENAKLTDNKPYKLFSDLLCVPSQNDPSVQHGLSVQGYIITGSDGISLLGIDAIQDDAFQVLEMQCSSGGKTLKGMVITHRHVLGNAQKPESLRKQTPFRKYVREHNIPVFLHGADAAKLADEVEPQVPDDLRISFEEPADHHPVLQDFGISLVAELEGHTQGGSLLLWQAHGGIVFAGDNAMGRKVPTPHDAAKLTRPPNFVSVTDDQLKQEWASVKLPEQVSGVCCLHGQPALGLAKGEMEDLRLHLGQHEPITVM